MHAMFTFQYQTRRIPPVEINHGRPTLGPYCYRFSNSLPKSENGMDTLLVVCDIMTRFVILRCISGKKMVDIARNMWEILSLIGIPKIIQSDNGSEFFNELADEFMKLNVINHRRVSAYNPRANGSVDRINANVENVLRKKVDGAMHTWPDYVPYVQLVCNCKTSTLTGTSPFALMFGRGLNEFEKYGRSKKQPNSGIIQWRARQKTLINAVYPEINE